MRFIAYYRVSTARQGRSGLGLEAQRETVRQRIGDIAPLAEFVEIETGTAKRDRPKLREALSRSRALGARLIVANVSRLTRDPDFMSVLVAAGVDVEFCDLPSVSGPVGTFMLRQMLSVAELEAGMISDRTRKALAAARARGVSLGGDRGNLPAVAPRGRAASLKSRKAVADRRAADISPIISELRAGGATSLRQIAAGLDRRGVPAPRGGTWSAAQVRRIIGRTDIFAPLP